MSKLEELLQGVDVEWKAIDDIIKVITAPCKVKKEIYKPIGKTPIIDQGKEYIAGYTDENFETVIADEYILFGDHSEHIKYVNFSFIQGADGLKILKIKKDFPKYIYYCFLNFYNKEYSYKRHWTNAKNTLIPIPCPDNPEKSLEIQQEIVRVLDGLSEQSKALTSALAQEIDQRKKQYEYYREELFRFEGKEVEWKSLGDVTEINTGGKPPIISDIQTQFEYINAGTTNSGYCHDYNCNGDIVTTPSRGQGGIGFIGYQLEKFWLGPLCYKINSKDNKKLLNKYIYYLLSSFRKLILELKKEGGVPAVNKSDLAKIKIPVPSLQEQERIVKLLDQFDATHTAIEEEITKEIKLRTQQYEYYREKLLNFPQN